MPPVPIDEPLGYRRGRRVSCNEAVGTAPIPHGHAIVNSLATAESLTATQRPKRALRRSVLIDAPLVAGRPPPPRPGPAGEPHRGLPPLAGGGVPGGLSAPDPPALADPDTVCIPLVMVWPAARESPVLRSFLDLVREHAETIRRMVPGGAAG